MSSGTDTIVNAGLGLIQSAFADAIKKTYDSASVLLDTLINGSSKGLDDAGLKAARKTALDNLKKRIKDDVAFGKDFATKVGGPVGTIKDAVGKMGKALGEPGGVLAGAKAAAYFADVLKYANEAIEGIADAAQPITGPSGAEKAQQKKIRDAIAAIDDPFTAPIRAIADKAGDAVVVAFNAVAKELFGIDGAAKKLAESDSLKWDREKKRFSAFIGKPKEEKPPKTKPGDAPAVNHGAVALITIDDTWLEVFLDLGAAPPRFGVKVESYVKAGLRGDPMLKSLIPTGADATDKSHVALEINSEDGLTLGEGKEERITLPVRFASAGVELRELAIGKTDSKQDTVEWLDVTAVVAAKFGEALAIVAEGGGIRLVSTNGGRFVPNPKLPDGLGFALAAGPVTGGGYLRHRSIEDDFGGMVDLKIGPVGVTAAAIIDPDPFSFVAVMGVRFAPKIELSFGFTLNGLGGLVALDRALSVDAMAGALKDGVVSNLLFPDDPIKQAPKILDQMATVFPAQAGALAIGPIVELGWGSQSGFVRAKLGVVLSLPDPAVVILGSAQIVVPPPEAGAAVPKVVDLKLDMMAVFTPDEVYFRASLGQSKIAGVPVSGDFGMIARWANGADFALSAGGFFPQYAAPPRLKDLRRIGLPLSPPVKAVTLSATAYFALTANSLQLGGQVSLKATIGPVNGEAEFGLDALFEWSPNIHFIFDVRASVKIKWNSYTVAGASFHGRLEGATPWHLEGKASVSILWWDVDFEPGPWTWGEAAPAQLAPVKALDAVAEAMGAKAAWSARSVTHRQTVRVHASDAETTLLLEPLSVLAVKQERVPIDTDIQRLGPNPTAERRLTFDTPGFVVGGKFAPAPIFGQVEADFAPGQFLNLTRDEQMSRPAFEKRPAGVELAAQPGVEAGPKAQVDLGWETFYPSVEQKGPSRFSPVWKLDAIAPAVLKVAPVAMAKQIADPYGPVVNPAETIGVRDPGLKDVAGLDQFGTAIAVGVTTVEAASLVAEAALAGVRLQGITAGMH